MSDAAEAAVPRGDLSLQNPRDRVAEPQIGMTNDRMTEPGRAVLAALIAAVPFTNSVSPTGFISVGPSARYIEPHSMKTVSEILWPLPMSASN
jgi:hypothetical protein